MRVGFVVAMEDEYTPFLSGLGVHVKDERIAGVSFSVYSVSSGREVVLARSGIGVVASSCATALLLSAFGCEYIVNFGLVGSLSSFRLGNLVAVRDVVHYDSDLTAFGSKLGAPADFDSPYFAADPVRLAMLEDAGVSAARLASGDKFISDSARKKWLVEEFAAEICDMEGAGVAITCARAKVPFTMLKLVSDGADEGAVADFSESRLKSFRKAVSVVRSVIESL